MVLQLSKAGDNWGLRREFSQVSSQQILSVLYIVNSSNERQKCINVQGLHTFSKSFVELRRKD